MDFFLEHIFAIIGILLGIIILHILEKFFHHNRQLRMMFATLNLVLHIFTMAFFLIGGAGVEELLLVLLLSLSVGLVRKEV